MEAAEVSRLACDEKLCQILSEHVEKTTGHIDQPVRSEPQVQTSSGQPPRAPRQNVRRIGRPKSPTNAGSDKSQRSDQRRYSSDSDGEQVRLHTRRSQAKRVLEGAEARFQKTRDDYGQELRRFQQINSTTRTRSEFDRAHLRTQMQQIKEISEAESEYERARLEAQEGGVTASESDESIFADRKDDGYRLSHETRTMAGVDRTKIDRWRDAVDRKGTGYKLPSPGIGARKRPGSRGRLSDLADVGVGESFSVIAYRPQRRRMERFKRRWSGAS